MEYLHIESEFLIVIENSYRDKIQYEMRFLFHEAMDNTCIS